jgi:hypothetical protein
MAEGDDEGVSTVNTNAKIVADHRLKYEDHECALTVKGLEEPRDIIVMINRINDNHGAVTGIRTITDDVSIIYYDRF